MPGWARRTGGPFRFHRLREAMTLRSTILLAGLLSLMAPAASARQASAFDHARLDAVLAAFVGAGGVDYAALQRGRAPLDEYARALAAVDSATFDSWPRAEKVAYMINAYNAHVLLGVIDNYPIRRSLRPTALVRPANSVWQIAGFFDTVRRRAAGRDLTLDEIEHGWLREVLREPRVHFALVCAARSCPPLRREAFVAARLDAQLDDQASVFFADARSNQLEPRRGVVRLSSILKWFGEDFDQFAPASGFAGSTTERGVLAYAARHTTPEVARRLAAGGYRIEYIDYDWTLNDAPARR
jgi:hypothetical protein